MNILSMRTKEGPEPPRQELVLNPDLGLQLLALARHGKPRVGLTGSGWYACIEMNTNTIGTSFEVKSEFGHPTPDAAVTQCAERVRGALEAIAKQ